MAKGTVSGNYLMYQGKPLIRQDNAYVWGDMKNDRAALLLLVLSNKEVNGKQVPDNILVQVVSTDDTQKVLKQGQKNGLYAIQHLNSRNSNAMKNHYLLTQIADILMQMYENGDKGIKELKYTIKMIV